MKKVVDNLTVQMSCLKLIECTPGKEPMWLETQATGEECMDAK